MEGVAHLALGAHTEEAGHMVLVTEAEDPSAPAPMAGALGAPAEEAAPKMGSSMVGGALRAVRATPVTEGLVEEAVALVISEEATSPAPAALGCANLAGEAAAW